MRHIRLSALALIIATAATPALAQTQSEQKNPEPICPYMPKPMQKQCWIDEKKPKISTEQYALKDRIKEVFLKAGIRVDVFTQVEQSKHSRQKKYPALLFHGYGLDRVGVYQIETRLKSIEAARAVGFKSVEYFDLGRNGVHTFDLTTPGKACSLDLCF